MNGLSTSKIRANFRSFLPLPPNLEPNLEAAILQVLENPGSLIRPQIVLQIGSAYSMDSLVANDLAMALEYFHTASLIFDDLPCMDNAAQRRGAPCVHLVYGEAGAILAALGLINRGYALSWMAISTCSSDRQQRAHAYLEDQLGVRGLLNGQSQDLHYSSCSRDAHVTEEIALAKTVSLIKLALVLPALIAGAEERELVLLGRIATFWGLSYQTLDDMKDLVKGESDTGKTGERDLLLGRPNIALAIGIHGAADRLYRQIQLGNTALRGLVARRPALAFLEKLRDDLEKESDLIRRHISETQAAGGS